jgi:hypothetical protein
VVAEYLYVFSSRRNHVEGTCRAECPAFCHGYATLAATSPPRQVPQSPCMVLLARVATVEMGRLMRPITQCAKSAASHAASPASQSANLLRMRNPSPDSSKGQCYQCWRAGADRYVWNSRAIAGSSQVLRMAQALRRGLARTSSDSLHGMRCSPCREKCRP